MNYRLLLLALFIVLAPSLVHAEATGTINFNTKNTSISTGLFAYTVGTCSSNVDCFQYTCYLDYDTVGTRTNSSGLCNATSSTAGCIHDDASSTFSITGHGNFSCVTGTKYRQCSNGVWGAEQSCSASQICSGGTTACIANSSSTTTTTSSGGTTVTTVTTTGKLTITASPSSLDIVQGQSSSFDITIKNTGNTSLTEIKLAISGISSSWHTSVPAEMILSVGNSNSFDVTLSIPSDAEVKVYTVTFTVTAKSGATDSDTMTLTVLPSAQTNVKINETYQSYLGLLAEVENNLSALQAAGANEEDINSVNVLITNAKTKLSQANEAILKSDYFTANALLDDAKGLLDAASRQLLQAKTGDEQAADNTLIIYVVIAAVIVAAAVLMYLFWPEKSVKHPLMKIFRGKK